MNKQDNTHLCCDLFFFFFAVYFFFFAVSIFLNHYIIQKNIQMQIFFFHLNFFTNTNHHMSRYLDLYCAAEKWLGVPFRWHGHTKGGCDCIGLIVGILHEKRVITWEDLSLYEIYKYGHNVSRISELYVNHMMLKYFNRFDGTKLKNGLVFRMKDHKKLRFGNE